MKINFDSKLVFFLIVAMASLSVQNSSESIDNKEIKRFLSKMNYIPKGISTMHLRNNYNLSSKDSTLLYPEFAVRKEIESFLISQTEVTNIEYREFYEAKAEDLGQLKAKELYYPDTLAWQKDKLYYAYNEPQIRLYNYQFEYYDYPVYGVSWDQAIAFCEYKTKEFNYFFGDSQIEIEFRLPSEDEWERAAQGRFNKEKIKDSVDRRVYPWDGISFKDENGYLANIGMIRDENNMPLNSYHTDGYLYTGLVGSFPPNSFGLFDMAGNVAEWVFDEPYNKVENFEKRFSESEYKRENDHEMIALYRSMDSHNRKILQKENLKIVKGGSWHDGMVYMQNSSRQVFPKTTQSTKVGFRIAASIKGGDIKKFLNKENIN